MRSINREGLDEINHREWLKKERSFKEHGFWWRHNDEPWQFQPPRDKRKKYGIHQIPQKWD